MQARVCSILVAIVAHVATAATVSSDFELKARFFPDGSWNPGDWNPWNLRIHADGSAVQNTSVLGTGTDRHIVKKIRLSPSAVAKIVAAFQEVHFFNLPR